MNSTDFACLVTGFLTDYLPLQRCCSKNTVQSYRDTLKLFLRFLSGFKGLSPNSFYMKDFRRELVIEFPEWYRENGASISAANQRLAALKAFAGYAQFESIECIAPLQDVSGIKAKKAAPKEVSFLNVEQMSAIINRIHFFREMFTAICSVIVRRCTCWKLGSTSFISEIFSVMRIFQPPWFTSMRTIG